jgi:hypothetical protein
MGNSIKMIASIIPILSKNMEDNDRWHFYLRLSPRLATGSQVSDHYVIQNWHLFAHLFTQEGHQVSIFNIDNRHPIPIDATPLNDGLGYHYYRNEWLSVRSENDDFNAAVEKLRTQSDFPSKDPGKSKDLERSDRRRRLWKTMINGDTRVDPWLLDPLPYKLTDKFNGREVKARMAKRIDDYVVQLLTQEDPTGSRSPLPGFDRVSLAAHLQSLKQYDPETLITDLILRDASLQDIRYSLLQDLSEMVATWKKELKALNGNFDLDEVETSNQNETCEFHKKMSAYSHYPFLLKQTGWVFEYSISLDEIRTSRPGQDGKFFIQFYPIWAQNSFNIDKIDQFASSSATDGKPTYDEVAMFFNEIEFVYPLTFIVQVRGDQPEERFYDAGDMEDLSRMLPKIDYLSLHLGFLTVNDPLFTFIPSIIEKNQMLQRIDDYLRQDYSFNNSAKTDSAANLKKRADASQPLLGKVDQQFTSLNHEHDQLVSQSGSGGQNSQYISSGISLSVKNLGTAVRTAVETNPAVKISTDLAGDPTFRDILPKLEGTAIIFKHHLHWGYRIDVVTATSGKVHSLSEREVLYSFKDEDGTEHTIVDIDEGWMGESTQVSAQSGGSDKVLIDEELARWNDWSLVTKHLFSAVDDYSKDSNDDYCSTLEICTFPFHRSLPRLRFGETYQFMIRTSDICGDSRSLNDAQANTHKENLVTKPLGYQRTEPINAPVLYLSEPLRTGSLFDDKSDSSEKHWGEDIATLVIRSYVDQRGITYNGQSTTRWLGPPKEDFHFVKKHGVLEPFIIQQQQRFEQGTKPLVSEESRQLIELSRQVYIKDKGAGKPDAVIADKQPVNYLFDPLVDTFIVIIDRKVVYPETAAFIRKSNLSATSEHGYWKDLDYFAIRLEPYNKDLAEYSVEADLDQLTIRLAPGLLKTVSLKCKNFDTLTTLHTEGHPVKRDAQSLFYYKKAQHNTTSVQLIHAVQKPCMLGESPTATPLEYWGSIVTEMRKPGDSSFSIHFSFDKFPCLTAESYLLHICYMELTCDRTLRTENGRRLDKVEKIVRTGFMPADPNSQYKIRFDDLTHPFPDAKYREATYRIEAVSKFKKYFPPAPAASDLFSVFGMSAESARVKCSMQPPPLKVARVVPLLDWQEEPITTGKRVTSACRTIRVYFEGDWWLTGDEEKVALFFTDSDKYNSSNIEKYFEPVVSQLGADAAGGKQPFKDAAKLNVVLNSTTISGGTVIDNDPDMRYLDYEGKTTHSGQVVPLKALAFDIQYSPPDENQGLGSYYIDICIDSKIYEDYFPFARFALARFQPESIGKYADLDYRFSKVVITDFVQLLPFRQLTIEPNQLSFAFIIQRKDAKDKLTNILRLVYCGVKAGADSEEAHYGTLYRLGNETPDYPAGGQEGLELDGLQQSNETWQDPVDHKTHTLSTVKFPLKDEFKNYSTDSFVFEEYEAYDWDRDLMDDFNASPREDFRKRLIFTYTQTQNYEEKVVRPGK